MSAEEVQERGFVRVALTPQDVGVRWNICSDSLRFWRAGLNRFGGPLKLAGTTRTLDTNFTALISLTGEYDFADAALLERALSDAFALTGHEVIVDLSEVTFLDAAVVSVFIRRRRACGDLFWVVAPAGGFPHRVLSLCGLVNASAAPSLQFRTPSAIDNAPSI